MSRMNTLQSSIYRMLLLLIIGLMINKVAAQKITLKLPYHKGKQVALLALNGIRQDTLKQIVLDEYGNGVFDLKESKKEPGIVGIQIKASSPPDVRFSWIYSPVENPIIEGSEKDEYIHSLNTKILHSKENQCFENWMTQYQFNGQKQTLIKDLIRLYQPNSNFYRQLHEENNEVSDFLKHLNDTIVSSELYAAKYLQINSESEKILNSVWLSDSTRNLARAYFLKLDFKALYHTGKWFETINPCFEAYIKGSQNYEKLGEDVVSILKRIDYLPAYVDLADATLTVCERFSWWHDQKKIVNYLLSDSRIQNYPKSKLSNKLQLISTTQKVQIGEIAPDVILTKIEDNQPVIEILSSKELNEKGNTLLVFHESGCGHCEETLRELTQHYSTFQQQGWRIISFSSDKDSQTFNQTANTFPWREKYCDLKGFNGMNFRNYAVMGTPILFVIDSYGKIVAKTPLIKDIIPNLEK